MSNFKVDSLLESLTEKIVKPLCWYKVFDALNAENCSNHRARRNLEFFALNNVNVVHKIKNEISIALNVTNYKLKLPLFDSFPQNLILRLKTSENFSHNSRSKSGLVFNVKTAKTLNFVLALKVEVLVEVSN